jgi:CheY-like chemotaxis protein
VLEDQLRQAQKMETLGQLAGSIAHDFNNLLTAIRGFAEIAAGSLDAEEPAIDNLREIERAADRAANLTKALLVFGRRTTPNATIVELNASVAGILPILRRLGGVAVTLETRLDPAAGSVRIDPGQLEQAILNLVVNARDAMPGGGVITIRTSRTAAGAASTSGVGAGAALTVHDTGSGMTPEVAARIFEPFFTTKATGEGTGLGLAILHGIVKDAGGDVSVESTPGQGTTIGFTLPVVAAGAAPVAEPSEALARGTETVLLVEDEDSIRMLASRMLGDHGYRVEAARDPAAAREIWSVHGAVIDLLLSDVALPGTTGLDLATELVRARPDLRVLFMSGFVPDGPGTQGLPGNPRFLSKPFTADALLRAVRRAIDGETLAPEADADPPAP